MHFTSLFHFWARTPSDAAKTIGPEAIIPKLTEAITKECDETRTYSGDAPDGFEIIGLFSVRSKPLLGSDDGPKWLGLVHHGGAENGNFRGMFRVLDVNPVRPFGPEFPPVELDANELCRKALEFYEPTLPLGLSRSDSLGYCLGEIGGREYAADEVCEFVRVNVMREDRRVDDAPDHVAALVMSTQPHGFPRNRPRLQSGQIFAADGDDLLSASPRLRAASHGDALPTSAAGMAFDGRTLWLAFVDFHL
jgi:hypothetical protein